ncbi:MAG: hypothetical protein RDU14_12480 [Melioribacteraceae bacterium]|nr:hypothetical protein [Melioribacteraceae bacterium]
MKTTSFVTLLFFIFIFSNISGLPRFALQQKDKCISCHINPTGGVMRNENGFYFGKNVVSMSSPRDKDLILSPKLTENISLGFDYRSQFIYSQEKDRADFQDMTGSIYLNASISRSIDVLARYDFINSIWEAYGVARILPNDSYIKVGSFVPYFGIRIDDHTSYTKGGDFGLLFSIGTLQGLIYNPLYTEAGIELGANISDWGLITASVGKSKFNASLTTDPTFTSRLEVNSSIDKMNYFLGGSFASTKVRAAGKRLNTILYGGFVGFGTQDFSLMGEYDVANDLLAQDIKSNAMMIEASYLLTVGLEAILRYDKFDPNKDIENDELAHLVFGFEFFPYTFIELRPQYRINLEEPSRNNNAFVLQFHFWY